MSYWKILCLDCGINTDLLMNKYQRVICRDCLDKWELSEIDSPMEDFSDEVQKD